MAQKKKCKNCGDDYTPTEEENFETKICDECFEMQETSQQEEIPTFSDADNGL